MNSSASGTILAILQGRSKVLESGTNSDLNGAYLGSCHD